MADYAVQADATRAYHERDFVFHVYQNLPATQHLSCSPSAASVFQKHHFHDSDSDSGVSDASAADDKGIDRWRIPLESQKDDTKQIEERAKIKILTGLDVKVKTRRDVATIDVRVSNANLDAWNCNASAHQRDRFREMFPANLRHHLRIQKPHQRPHLAVAGAFDQTLSDMCSEAVLATCNDATPIELAATRPTALEERHEVGVSLRLPTKLEQQDNVRKIIGERRKLLQDAVEVQIICTPPLQWKTDPPAELLELLELALKNVIYHCWDSFEESMRLQYYKSFAFPYNNEALCGYLQEFRHYLQVTVVDLDPFIACVPFAAFKLMSSCDLGHRIYLPVPEEMGGGENLIEDVKLGFHCWRHFSITKSDARVLCDTLSAEAGCDIQTQGMHLLSTTAGDTGLSKADMLSQTMTVDEAEGKVLEPQPEETAVSSRVVDGPFNLAAREAASSLNPKSGSRAARSAEVPSPKTSGGTSVEGHRQEAGETTTAPRELAALLALRNQTNLDVLDEAWANLEEHKCASKCSGISLNSEGQVSKIQMSRKGLTGELPDLSGLLHLEVLDVSENKLSGSLPSLTKLSKLKVLAVNHNSISGSVPDLSKLKNLEKLGLNKNCFCGSLPDLSRLKNLKALAVDHNANLSGMVSKQVILRCSQIAFGSCKQRSQCSNKEKMRQYGWMQFPFIVGFSFSSADVDFLMVRRELLGINDANLLPTPQAGDVRFQMIWTHGYWWCPWQEAWLHGLEALKNQDVYVQISEPSGETDNSFREKFEEQFDQAKCVRSRFDPAYRLDGAVARSILDWEKLQLERVAKSNNLTLKFISCEFSRLTEINRPCWYCSRPELPRAVFKLESCSCFRTSCCGLVVVAAACCAFYLLRLV